jgi:hypothetical protein
MTNINSLGYYSLFNPTGSGNTPTNATDALLQTLNAVDSSGSNSSNDFGNAFSLDLSPQAQQILNASGVKGVSQTSLAGILNGTGNTSPLSALLGGGDNSGLSGLFGGSAVTSFAITKDQQDQITAIIAKYKDAPYTQDTFNQIQNDLSKAGLAPSIMALKDQTKAFNPAEVLISALNGTSMDTVNSQLGTDATGEQTKQNTYIASIIKQWQDISTTYAATSSTASAATTGA